MEKRGLSQETLKVIACVTMLLDHIGAMLVGNSMTESGLPLRIIGRISFPIFCFLLAEGAYYTKNPQKYALRLLIGMLLSEIPYDLAFRYQLTLETQSVMVTLLVGFLTLEAVRRAENNVVKLLIMVGGIVLGELFKSDYGGFGVMMVLMFSLTRGHLWIQTICLVVIAWVMNSAKLLVFGVMVPIEIFAVFAMIPIGLYSGRKACSSRAVQWAFYLFYPVHLTVLVCIRYLIEAKII